MSLPTTNDEWEEAIEKYIVAVRGARQAEKRSRGAAEKEAAAEYRSHLERVLAKARKDFLTWLQSQ